MMKEYLTAIQSLGLSLHLTQKDKDVIIETYLSSLEEKLLDIDIPKDKFNNLSKEERDALYSLKNDKTIIIKGADKGSAVVVWDREDYLKEAHKQLSDEEIYEEATNDPSTVESTIFTALNKIRARGDLSADNLEYFFNKDPKSASFISYQIFINGYIMFLVDQ